MVVHAGDVKSLPVIRAINDLSARAAARPDFKQPITTSVSPDHTVEQVEIPVAGNGTDSRSTAALAQLRDKLIPVTIGRVPGATADVSGYTASSTDFNNTMKSHAPVVLVLVLSAAFVLLLFTFRSLVIPLKAIILNLLSVGAAYGVMVWIFQEGHLESLLGFKSNGAIVSWMPLFLFVVLFAISMDYTVFLLSSAKEHRDRSHNPKEAMIGGLAHSGRVIFAAGAEMVAVFFTFALSGPLPPKEMGIILGIAVLLDAALIRLLLLPVLLRLMGRWAAKY